jgi:toxin ParE1/3/4
MPRYTLRARAWRDISQVADYLEEQAGIEVAARFLTNVRAAAQHLAEMPLMGSVYGFQRPSLKRLRRWPVRGFESWLIFYLPTRDGVDIVRVIHGSRDIASVLGERQT